MEHRCEVMEDIQHLRYAHCLQDPTFPVGPIFGPNDQIGTADDVRSVLLEVCREQTFKDILMRNQHVAARAVAAGGVEREEMMWLDVDDEWQLARFCGVTAPRTGSKACVRVRIEEEAVAGRLCTESRCCCRSRRRRGLSLGHRRRCLVEL